MVKGNDTFIEVTNKDIYDKITSIQELHVENHTEVCSHLKTTNGKVKLNTWRSTAALGMLATILVILTQHIVGS